MSVFLTTAPRAQCLSLDCVKRITLYVIEEAYATLLPLVYLLFGNASLRLTKLIQEKGGRTF